jgi:hypothetical protein
MAIDYTNPYQSEIVGLDRQRKLADLLLKQGMDQNSMQGQMVSGRYVGASPWQGIANLANIYVAKSLGEEADTKQQAIADKLRKLGQEEVYNIMATAKGRPAGEEQMAGPYDPSQGIKAPTIQYPEIKPNQDMALTMAGAAQTPEGRAFAPALMANALPRDITPYEKEKLRLDEENLKLQRANANRASFSAIEGTPYAMNSRTGEIVTLKDPVTGQPLAPKLPAHLQNEVTAINQQKSAINDVLQSVEKNQQAFGPKFGAVGLLPFGDVAQNRKFTEEELKARSKVFNTASAVMKERAGTAMSESEKKIVSRFLPNEFDDANTIMKKMIGFNEYLTAKERGTIPVVGGVSSYVPNTGGSTVAAPATPAAPAAPASAGNAPRSFSSEADAARAGLPDGTPIIIGGVRGTWKN